MSSKDNQPVQLVTIEDIKQDNKNANRGTERGADLLSASLRRNGAGRSVVVDKNGRLIAGNKTVLAAQKAGMPIEVIQTTGDRLVIVQRVDLDLDQKGGKARELAIADNRASEVGLDWDVDVLLEQIAYIDNPSIYFDQGEIDKFVTEATALLVKAPNDYDDSDPDDDHPEDFKSYDESISTEYQCPKCGYRWSGKPQ